MQGTPKDMEDSQAPTWRSWVFHDSTKHRLRRMTHKIALMKYSMGQISIVKLCPISQDSEQRLIHCLLFSYRSSTHSRDLEKYKECITNVSS